MSKSTQFFIRAYLLVSVIYAALAIIRPTFWGWFAVGLSLFFAGLWWVGGTYGRTWWFDWHICKCRHVEDSHRSIGVMMPTLQESHKRCEVLVAKDWGVDRLRCECQQFKRRIHLIIRGK